MCFPADCPVSQLQQPGGGQNDDVRIIRRAAEPCRLLAVQLLGDINPAGSSSPTDLTNVNGTLFFAANDGTNGEELWKTTPLAHRW